MPMLSIIKTAKLFSAEKRCSSGQGHSRVIPDPELRPRSSSRLVLIIILIILISSANPDLSHQQIQTCITTSKLIILILPSCSAKQSTTSYCTISLHQDTRKTSGYTATPPPPRILRRSKSLHLTTHTSSHPEKKPNSACILVHASPQKIKINEKKKPSRSENRQSCICAKARRHTI